MATTNPITGDEIRTKPSNTYADNFDSIFRKPQETDHANQLLKDDDVGFNK